MCIHYFVDRNFLAEILLMASSLLTEADEVFCNVSTLTEYITFAEKLLCFCKCLYHINGIKKLQQLVKSEVRFFQSVSTYTFFLLKMLFIFHYIM